ncbi:hypothetical protein CHS0354_023717 [Potamilus streckersoni]|uniref:MotA/TolQ/ExbB proton channel domain-containing protein n=1 Tax=Potamilus streckersoni TaxID=2493646 RepID=A0AAE0VLN5_9BIVA|nr:hypothetical protein CHS0354_023717 [Potamilus streckersoni]
MVLFYGVFKNAPKGSVMETLTHGGPLVAVLMINLIVLIIVILERIWAFSKAKGKGSVSQMLKAIKQDIQNGDLAQAIEKCKRHKSSISSSIQSGLERYRTLDEVEPRFNAKIQEVQKAVDESANFEASQFEANLTPIKTIATIATLIGLLGTTFGMIGAFAVLAESGGTPDPAALSLSISEALYNTAGGLGAAILGTVAYNYFKADIDSFTYQIDEATFEVIQTITIARRNLEIELKPELPTSSSITKEPDSRYITVVVGDSAKNEDKFVVYMADASVREKSLDEFATREQALSQKGFEIARDKLVFGMGLPQESGGRGGSSQKSVLITLKVSKDGVVFMGKGEDKPDLDVEKVDFSKLKETFVNVIKSLSSDEKVTLVVKLSSKVKFGAVIDILDEIYRGGITEWATLTLKPEEEKFIDDKVLAKG